MTTPFKQITDKIKQDNQEVSNFIDDIIETCPPGKSVPKEQLSPMREPTPGYSEDRALYNAKKIAKQMLKY